jgi:inorganic pyrophosphatase
MFASCALRSTGRADDDRDQALRFTTALRSIDAEMLSLRMPSVTFAETLHRARCRDHGERLERMVSVEVDARSEPPELEVVIEIPKGSFVKRGSTRKIDFISPLPCPFNYGSVPKLLGLEGDLLDAVVLGPRLPQGSRLTVKARGAVILMDRGMTDDKLICSDRPLSRRERRNVLRFFRLYAKCKGVLNFFRGRSGRNACDGWCEAGDALLRARPRDASWRKPPVGF